MGLQTKWPVFARLAKVAQGGGIDGVVLREQLDMFEPEGVVGQRAMDQQQRLAAARLQAGLPACRQGCPLPLTIKV